MGFLVGEEQGLKKGGGRALLVWKAATCRHGGQAGRLAGPKASRSGRHG